MRIGKTNRKKNEEIENLQKEYETLEDTVSDFLAELEAFNVEIPLKMYEIYSELYELVNEKIKQ